MTTTEKGYHTSNVTFAIDKSVTVMHRIGGLTKVTSYQAGELETLLTKFNEVQVTCSGVSKVKCNKVMKSLELAGFSPIACNWRNQESEIYSFNIIYSK